jgi:small nuclear ribonucleoprotein (snRNP)-like protein
MTYYFKNEQEFFSQQYKVVLTDDYFLLLKWFTKDNEEIILQVNYENITNIHLQVIERNREDIETAFMEFLCIIKTANSSQDIVIRGDNSHSYSVFLNYLHAYCTIFTQITYTYEVDYTLVQIQYRKRDNNYFAEHPYILYLLAPLIIIFFYNFYIALFLLVICFFMFFPSSENTITENIIEKGVYSPQTRPKCLLV